MVHTDGAATGCQARLEHRRVLDGAAEHGPRAGRDTGDGEVVRLGAATCEHDVAGARSEQPSEPFAGIVEGPLGGSRDGVAPGRIAVAVD